MTPTGRETTAPKRRNRGDRERFARQVLFVGLCASVVVLAVSLIALRRRTEAADGPALGPSMGRGGGGWSGASSRLVSSSGHAGGRAATDPPEITATENAYADRYARTRFVPPAASGEDDEDDQRTPMFHRLPNVLMVGAQKAGTTSVANLLFEAGACKGAVIGDEPEYFAKEVQFFNDEDRYAQGLPFYAERYAHCPEGSMMLDATPNYMTYVRRIRAAYDDAGGGQADRVKIIVILREPIARELSWYNHLVYQLRKDDPPEYAFMVARDLDKPGGPGAAVINFGQYVHEQTLALLLGPARRFDTATPPCHQDKYSEFPPCFGLYGHFLEEWFDWFDRSRVLVLSYDELMNDPDTLKGRVAGFLGLDKSKVEEIKISKSANKHATASKVTKPGCTVNEKLIATFEKPNNDLYELLERRPGPPMEQRPFPKFVEPECEGA